MKKRHLRLWVGLGDYGFGHPRRNGRLWRLDGADRSVREQSRRTKSTLRRMASVAHCTGSMSQNEKRRRAASFAACLTRPERDAAMLQLFGPPTKPGDDR